MRLLCVNLKYGPWRQQLMNSWEQRPRRVASGCQGVAKRADVLLKTLLVTCKQMHGRHHDVRAWGVSLGYRVARANGPLATLSRLGITLPPAKGCKVHASNWACGIPTCLPNYSNPEAAAFRSLTVAYL